VNVRGATSGDFEQVVTLLREDAEHLLRAPSRIGLSDLREWLTGVDLARDTWLVDGGSAFGWANVVGDLGWAVGVVHPRAKGRGLGAELLERSDAALRARDGVKRIHQFAIGSDDAARALLESRGYHDARHFFEMAIELERAPDVPDVPVDVPDVPLEDSDEPEDPLEPD
jgi:GNAT superfamily N-acetyltransferase